MSEAPATGNESGLQGVEATTAAPESSEGADKAVEPVAETQPELVEPDVSAELVAQLEEMGFSKHRAVRALHFSGNSTMEGAINWLEEHAEDADLDEPLLVPKAPPKKQLTPEEAKARAAELQAKAKAKREKEEREMEKLREKERIRMGKELSAAARIEEEQKLQRIADERRREKEEEARAKEKIRLKLEEDRRVRRRKLGLPEELTEEEKAEEERRKAERAAAESSRKLVAKPVSRITAMREILTNMKKTSDPAKFQTCCKTLNAYCKNVYMNMGDESKRTIKLENKALQERVACMPGGLDFLHQVGFEKQEADGILHMPIGNEAYEKAVLQGAAEVLDSAMNNPMFGML